MIQPIGPEVLVVQVLHRGRDPGPHVHAVGDVTDGDLVLAMMRPQHLPRLARHPPVQVRNPVGVPGHLEREHRHAQRLAVILGADPPEAEELLARQAQRAPQGLEVLVDQLGREAIVPGVDGGVGGEHRRLRHVLGHRPEVRPRGLHAQACELERGEGAVPFVQMQPAPVDAGRPQRPHAAHPEQQLLTDAHPLITEVKARPQPRGSRPSFRRRRCPAREAGCARR